LTIVRKLQKKKQEREREREREREKERGGWGLGEGWGFGEGRLIDFVGKYVARRLFLDCFDGCFCKSERERNGEKVMLEKKGMGSLYYY
jgi:hypothetical protein